MTRQDISGGELFDPPNDNYRKFFDKFKEIDTLNVAEYKPVHLLAYFVNKYEKHYGTKYKFKFNSSAPSKCFEIFQIKKLASMLSSNPTILKEYIDWVFETRVVKAKRRLTSISFMTVEDVVNEYKLNVYLVDRKTIDRSTILPDKIKGVFQEINVYISTYGELAFLVQMSNMPESYKLAFQKVFDNGLDKDILGKII